MRITRHERAIDLEVRFDPDGTRMAESSKAAGSSGLRFPTAAVEAAGIVIGKDILEIEDFGPETRGRQRTRPPPDPAPGVRSLRSAHRIERQEHELSMSVGEPDAGEVVAAAARGDREAIRAVWQEHRRWVAAVLLAHKPRHVELEDLLQDVAMTLVSKIDTLRDASNIRAWLRTVAINAARASARGPRLRLAGAVADDADSVPAVSPPPAGDESQRVLALTAALPEPYREPLMLRAVHGMRSRDIAQTLGINEAAVDTRIARARRMLREAIEAADDTGPVRSTIPFRLHAEGNA
jgi:RNA polymerase sigma-70 factor (ECF subfamily)